MSVIYKIINKIDGKFYIGKTTKLINTRFQFHYYAHKNKMTYLYKAMRKYGFNNFDIQIIEETTSLDEREKYWITKLKPQYNMTSGGEGGDTSKSPNFIKAIKFYHKNKKRSSYASYGMLGKKQTKHFLESIVKSNSCPLMCEGKHYASVKEAQLAYPRYFN